jgi:hypothetical protein
MYKCRVPQCMSARRNGDSPTPLPLASVPPPPGTKGGEGAFLQVRGGRVQIPTTGEKAWHSAYSVDVSMYFCSPKLLMTKHLNKLS